MIHKSCLLTREKILKQRVAGTACTRHYLADASSGPYLRREDKGWLSTVRIVVSCY